MLVRGFWDNLKKPIIGLSPMDGVTDAPFRYIVNKYGKPDLTVTEFTNVEGLARGAEKMLLAFLYDEIERPIVAQIYGVEVESFYKAAVMLAYLGFDGVDINMGCPANKVAKRGSGAALIKTPDLAKEIIRACKKGAKDWAEGISLEDAGVHPNIIKAAGKMRERMGLGPVSRDEIPVSAKTRIGFDEVVATEWVKHLMEEEPANISMHGRTLKQMYNGEADWEVIAKAGEVLKGSGISYLGNGDVKSMEDARAKIEKYGVDGVLIGRATFGNPWLFDEKVPEMEERFRVCLEHCRYLEEKVPEMAFWNLRKHMAWYLKNFEGAKEMRVSLMKANSSEDVEKVVGRI